MVLSQRSSILTMLSDVPANRIIKSFPPPYSTKLTPYSTCDFSERTKDICENNQRNRSVECALRICKVIILGDVCVGKTCIVNRFCHQLFETSYKATIGVDFEVEKFELLKIPFNMQIWDTAGQERFKCIAQAYYRSAHVVIVVFDASSIATLGNCKVWLREALAASNAEPFIFLVATKVDLLTKASCKVVEEYASKVAKSLNAEYWPTSSKTGKNIEQLFFRIAALAFDKCVSHETFASNVKIGSDLVSFKRNTSKKDKKSCTDFKCS